MSDRTALLEAGAAGQRLMLAAQESGLGLCPIVVAGHLGLLAETHASSHVRAASGLRELETELHAEAAG